MPNFSGFISKFINSAPTDASYIDLMSGITYANVTVYKGTTSEGTYTLGYFRLGPLLIQFSQEPFLGYAGNILNFSYPVSFSQVYGTLITNNGGANDIAYTCPPNSSNPTPTILNGLQYVNGGGGTSWITYGLP
jgi:hypothetical protein